MDSFDTKQAALLCRFLSLPSGDTGERGAILSGCVLKKSDWTCMRVNWPATKSAGIKGF